MAKAKARKSTRAKPAKAKQGKAKPAKAKPTRAKKPVKTKPARAAKPKAAAKQPSKQPAPVAAFIAPALPALPPGEDGFDTLADYFVTHIVAAAGDDAKLRAIIARSILGFYDHMEAAGQERGERSGEFFWVDGVAMEDTDRELPIVRVQRALGERGSAVTERVIALWEAAQLSVR
jgi:hypothetical protein